MFLIQSTKDIIKNIPRIISLARFEYELGTKDMFFGKLWKILSPFIQIGAYWFVFGVGIRQGKPIEGVAYVIWLTCGITPWFMINKGISDGANSIYRKATMLTKSNIPTVIVPISTCLAVIIDNLWSVALMFVIFLANGGSFSLEMFNVLYYVVYTYAFISSLSLITSVFVILARDFQKVIQMIMRLMFFLSPIMWKPGNNMPQWFMNFNQWNPIAYVVNGFRESMVYKMNFWHDPISIAIFWGVNILLYLFGIAFQKKLRNNLLDYI